MVDLMSRWPIQFCSVRMSTPCRKCSVAKVCRNLCRKKCRQYGPWAHLFPCLVTHCPQFNSARSATRLTIMSFSLSGFPFELGNSSCEGSPLLRSRSFCNCRRDELRPGGGNAHGCGGKVFLCALVPTRLRLCRLRDGNRRPRRSARPLLRKNPGLTGKLRTSPTGTVALRRLPRT